MPVVSDAVSTSLLKGAKRQVSIRRDDRDFVVAFQPNDVVIFRHQRASPLRKLCASLRWEIVNDTIASADDSASWCDSPHLPASWPGAKSSRVISCAGLPVASHPPLIRYPINCQSRIL